RLATAFHERRQVLDRRRLGKILRRSTQAEPRVSRKRLVFANNVFKTSGNTHARILTPNPRVVSIAISSKRRAQGVSFPISSLFKLLLHKSPPRPMIPA